MILDRKKARRPKLYYVRDKMNTLKKWGCQLVVSRFLPCGSAWFLKMQQLQCGSSLSAKNNVLRSVTSPPLFRMCVWHKQAGILYLSKWNYYVMHHAIDKSFSVYSQKPIVLKNGLGVSVSVQLDLLWTSGISSMDTHGTELCWSFYGSVCLVWIFWWLSMCGANPSDCQWLVL